MGGAVKLLLVDACIRYHRCRIEHAETDASCEQTNQRGVDRALRKIALLYGFDVRFVVVIVFHFCEVDAFVVHPSLQRNGRGLWLGGAVVMAAKDVADRIAVRDHITLELPGTTKRVLQEKLAGAGWLTVDPVICAHDGARVALHHSGAKSRQVGVFLVVFADVHVGKVACGLRPAVYGIVFRCGDDAIVVRIIALHAGYESDGHARAQEGIFAISLLAAAPARVAKDVDVRSPEVESLKDVRVSISFVLCVFDSSFNADGCRHLVNAWCIEGRRKTDGFGELRYAVGNDTM